MIKKFALPVVAALFALTAAPQIAPHAQPRQAYRESFLPPNNLRHKIGALDSGGISQEQFNAVMDRMQELYGPIIAARGGKLVIKRLWDDATVNASAQREGSDYVLNMYGGLARDKAITQDGMALVACHEMGHHLGGAPKYGGTDWAANEGEADYFAATKCLHRFFGEKSADSFTRAAAPNDDAALARESCAKSYAGGVPQAVCARSAAAGLSVTALFQELSGSEPAHFDTPDASKVTETNDEHPASQCRLDTYYQGALCPKPFTVDMDDKDPAVGACVASQGYKVGLRPRCWYAPPAGEPRLDEPVASAPARTSGGSATLAALQSRGGEVWKGL